MKALIVSDALQESLNIQSTLEQVGYDTICYRWLLKALDNVEEIQPHVVVINTIDYPRHWKLMVQHMKCNLKKQPKIILLTATNFDEEEAEKADILGISGCITGVSQKHMERLSQLLEERSTYSSTTSPSEAKILFIHPYEGTLYSGQIIAKEDEKYNLITDGPVSLKAGDEIKDGSMKTTEGIKNLHAKVIETDPELILDIN